MTQVITKFVFAAALVGLVAPAMAYTGVEQRGLSGIESVSRSTVDGARIELARRGRGADDPAGNDRGGRGRGSDDPVGHG